MHKLFSHYDVNDSMITMNSPTVCLADSPKLQAKLFAQALLDLDHLVSRMLARTVIAQ